MSFLDHSWIIYSHRKLLSPFIMLKLRSIKILPRILLLQPKRITLKHLRLLRLVPFLFFLQLHLPFPLIPFLKFLLLPLYPPFIIFFLPFPPLFSFFFGHFMSFDLFLPLIHIALALLHFVYYALFIVFAIGFYSFS